MKDEPQEPDEHEAQQGEQNRGYAIMKKMGWRGKGTGLGKDGGGIAEPIADSGSVGRLGLGRLQAEAEHCAAATSKRVPMVSELVAAAGSSSSLSEEDRLKRELIAERDRLILEETREAKRAFWCELCGLQYSNATQFEGHVKGLGHNHKKRLLEAKQAERLATSIPQSERQKREKKSEEKQLQRLMAVAAAAATVNPKHPTPPPIMSPPPPPPPPPPSPATPHPPRRVGEPMAQASAEPTLSPLALSFLSGGVRPASDAEQQELEEGRAMAESSEQPSAPAVRFTLSAPVSKKPKFDVVPGFDEGDDDSDGAEAR